MPEEQQTGYQSKLSFSEFILLLLTAIALDLITWIPFLGTVINFLATIIFWLIFWLKDIKLTSVKSLLPGFVEMIPVFNIFPTWTLTVIVTYLLEKAQEKIPAAAMTAQTIQGKK